ncbi:MAG: magnesium transporter [Limisphaerales bacterium]
MIGNLLKPELLDMIQRREFSQLREALAHFPPADVAEIFSQLDPEEKAILLRILPTELAADVFEYLSFEEQEKLLLALGNEKVAQILNEMTPDDRTAILKELPARVTQRLLTLLSPEERKIAVQLLGYPEESIGRRMTPEYVAINESWTISEVLGYLRKVGKERETLNELFVIDGAGKLAGSVQLHEVVTAELDMPVSQLIQAPAMSLKVTDDQETAVQAFKKYDRTTLPVVDPRGVLLGVVTVDDVLDVAEQEATEDFHKGGGIEPLTTSLSKARFRDLYNRRISWLVILVFVNIFSGAGIALFEDLIASVVALVFFLPLLIASSGNAGAQSATLIIRSFAVGEIQMRDYVRVLSRELWVAMALGLTLTATVFPLALWRSGLNVAIVVGISMLIVVFIGSIVGMSLPFILRRFNLDPAAASSPLVTSLADISGVLIYLSIAKALLDMTA